MHDGCEKDGSSAGEARMFQPADVVLRPANMGRDAEALRKAMADSWRVPRFNSTAAFEVWLRERLEREWLEFAVVAPAGNPNRVAGYAVAWDYRPVDGHAHMEVRVGGTTMNGSDGWTRLTASSRPDTLSQESLFAQAAGAFVSRLFREYPLRKAFIEEVVGDARLCDGAAAAAQLGSAEQSTSDVQPVSYVHSAAAGRPAAAGRSLGGLPALKHEMTLKEYTFRRGAYRDLDVWSLSRETWEEWVRG